MAWFYWKKPAKRHNVKVQPYTVFCKRKYYSKYQQKGPRPSSNHSVCNYHLLQKNKKRTRTLCSSCVTGSHTGRQKSASNPCVSSFSYECCVLPFPCPMKWGGTAGLTSLRAKSYSTKSRPQAAFIWLYPMFFPASSSHLTVLQTLPIGTAPYCLRRKCCNKQGNGSQTACSVAAPNWRLKIP